EATKKNIKFAVYNPNTVIIYDNFNFINYVKKLVGRKKNRIVNLITSYIIAYLKLGGLLK
ncbi:hypothetical protein CONLIGDRAFT_587608, partial [Coniochaeta ligniaria NRRL 30616]